MSLETFLVDLLIPFLGDYFLIIALIGTIISGNIFVLFLSTLAGQGIFSYFSVLLICLVGTFIADAIWFNIGKTRFVDNLLKRPHFLYNYKYLKKALHKSSEKNKFFVFLGSKFVYGTKILTLMYSGRRKMHIDHFIKYNYISSTIWVATLVTIGFLAGKGFTKILEFFDNLRLALTVFILAIASVYFAWFVMSEIILRRR